jgi:hypothetical protein
VAFSRSPILGVDEREGPCCGGMVSPADHVGFGTFSAISCLCSLTIAKPVPVAHV